MEFSLSQLRRSKATNQSRQSRKSSTPNPMIENMTSQELNDSAHNVITQLKRTSTLESIQEEIVQEHIQEEILEKVVEKVEKPIEAVSEKLEKVKRKRGRPSI